MARKQKKSDTDSSRIEGELWAISTKILGLGHLIKGQDGDALPRGEPTYGIGEILIDLAEQLDQVREALGTQG